MRFIRRACAPCAISALIFLTWAIPPADAQDTESPRVKIDLAAGTWISSGETRWAHNASGSSALLGNPTSKLIYQDHGTNVAELTAKVAVGPRFFARLNLGYAGIGSGQLTDNDYLAADGGNPSLTTQSDINGNAMFYLNADVGARAMNFANRRGWLEVFGGFQYWHQEYQAFGVQQVNCTNAGASVDLGGGQTLCNPGAAPIPNSVLAITNTTNWYSLRVGGQIEYQLTSRFGVQGSVTLLPVSIMETKDTHHLRNDLQQNPSFSMVGIGMGADVDVGAKFMIIRNLFVNVGYRLWWNYMIDGTWTNHPVGASSESFPLTQFQTYRQGLTAGINYTF
ncbi:MAG TPA: hypothetical protein VLE03_10860 [Nitrospiraceae bacterium]|nr:hypothetical protein [Nitrospiraceae bacterium]